MHDIKIIIALDYDTIKEVDSLCEKLDPSFCRLKIGKQLFTRYGAKIVNSLQIEDMKFFLISSFMIFQLLFIRLAKQLLILGFGC